jgi:hypothetical protein
MMKFALPRPVSYEICFEFSPGFSAFYGCEKLENLENSESQYLAVGEQCYKAITAQRSSIMILVQPNLNNDTA